MRLKTPYLKIDDLIDVHGMYINDIQPPNDTYLPKV